MAKPVVLPDCVGPITITDSRGSAAIRWPSIRPSVSRPGCDADTQRAEIARLAQRAPGARAPLAAAMPR